MDGGYSAGFLADFITTYSSGAVTWEVLYNGNGNTGGAVPVDPSSPYDDGDPVTVLGNTGLLVKTGSIWNNWNTASDGSGTDRLAGTSFNIASDETLYAQWVEVGPPVSGGGAAGKLKLARFIYGDEEENN